MPVYAIRGDRVHIDGAPAPYVASPHHGGRIEPTLIVIHDTAGRLDPGSAVAWLADPRSKVSAHLVVERDGSITQMVDLDRAAWHCGESVWKGRRHCNGFAIGIEIVAPGKLKKAGDCGVAWFGGRWACAELETHDSAAHGGPGLWLPYTPAQTAAVRGLVAALATAYPSITDVAGHYEISPGRKVDPGPHFDLAALQALLAGRAAPEPADVRAVQDRLRALKYFPGATDGALGPRTRSALRDFQDAHGLPVTGQPDARTLAALGDDAAKPAPTGAREALTVTDVAAQGSRVIRVSQAVKRAIEAATAAAVVAAPVADASLPDIVTGAGDLVTAAERAKGLGERLLALAGWAATGTGAITLGAFALAAAVWGGLHMIERWRLADARSGANIGR